MPGLTPVQPGGDPLRLDRGGPPAGLAEGELVEGARDIETGVHADEVRELEGPHAKAAPEAHDAVDRRHVRDPLAQHPQGLQAEGAVAAVDEEPGAVGGADHGLAHRQAGGVGERERGLGGAQAGDHLDERHQRGGVEEVHPDDSLGGGGARGDPGDRQRGGVSGEHAVAGDDLREPCVELTLELGQLRRGLDHQLARRKRLKVRGDLQPLGSRAGLISREPTPRRFLLKTPPRALGPPRERLGEGVVQQRARPGAAGELRDARAHRAGSQHADDACGLHLRRAPAR